MSRSCNTEKLFQQYNPASVTIFGTNPVFCPRFPRHPISSRFLTRNISILHERMFSINEPKILFCDCVIIYGSAAVTFCESASSLIFFLHSSSSNNLKSTYTLSLFSPDKIYDFNCPLVFK